MCGRVWWMKSGERQAARRSIPHFPALPFRPSPFPCLPDRTRTPSRPPGTWAVHTSGSWGGRWARGTSLSHVGCTDSLQSEVEPGLCVPTVHLQLPIGGLGQRAPWTARPLSSRCASSLSLPSPLLCRPEFFSQKKFRSREGQFIAHFPRRDCRSGASPLQSQNTILRL